MNLLDVEEARWWELPVVFVVGLAQGAFPLHPREDVLLHDQDRERLREGPDPFVLPLSRDREGRERRLFYVALTRARRRLVLFRPGCNADGDAVAPSLFLRAVERVVPLAEGAVHRPLGRAAPARAEACTVLDWALFAASTARDPRASEGDRELALALLARDGTDLRRRAARFRRPAEDPLPAEAGTAARFAASTARMTATSAEALVACRHRHFLRRVVGVPEDQVPFGGPTLGFREEGTLLHEALRVALADPGLSPEAAVAAAFARAAGRDRTLAAALAGPDGALLEEEMRRVVVLFRRREADLESPLAAGGGGLEVEFGQDGGLLLGDGGGALRARGADRPGGPRGRPRGGDRLQALADRRRRGIPRPQRRARPAAPALRRGGGAGARRGGRGLRVGRGDRPPAARPVEPRRGGPPRRAARGTCARRPPRGGVPRAPGRDGRAPRGRGRRRARRRPRQAAGGPEALRRSARWRTVCRPGYGSEAPEGEGDE